MRMCEISNEVLTSSGFVINDGDMYAKGELEADQVAVDCGYESFEDMHEQNPDSCYYTEWEDPEDWYDLSDIEDSDADFMPVYHDQIETLDDVVMITRFCPFRLVPSVMAIEFGEAMVSLGRWSSFCAPQLSTQPIQFILP
jgi:hypothetical protein